MKGRGWLAIVLEELAFAVGLVLQFTRLRHFGPAVSCWRHGRDGLYLLASSRPAPRTLRLRWAAYRESMVDWDRTIAS